MSDIKVEEVRRINGKAVQANIMAIGVLFKFYLQPNGKISHTKSRPEAQVHDPSACWVPKRIFTEIYKTAAAILKPKK